MLILFLLSLVLICAGFVENILHQRNLHSISVRIHVNGIRGKSTTTRLIAGGLREAGWKVMAKTTGTAARLILEDGSEVPIVRRGSPRIIEQRKVVAAAARSGTQILVTECMAVHPEMQWVAERRLIQSQIGVITNVREDHLDQMGSTLEQLAHTLALTIPVHGNLVTSEETFLPVLETVAADLQTSVHSVHGGAVTEEEMREFSYPTFPENVACALKVCEILGVPRELALRGMQHAAPDPGVLRVYRLPYRGRNIYLVNAMAANDYTSTLQAWRLCETFSFFPQLTDGAVMGIANHRADRMTRVRELAPLVREIPFAAMFLIGEMGKFSEGCLKRAGFDLSQVRDHTGPLHIDRLLDGMFRESAGDLLAFAFGNIKGPGELLLRYFEQNGEELR